MIEQTDFLDYGEVGFLLSNIGTMYKFVLYE